MLRQVIYVSHVTAPLSKAAENQILGISQRNNRRAGLSGILASSSNYFLQVLEGPAATVKETLARIVADDRHDRLSILGDRPVETRRYGEWSMAYVYNLDLAEELEALCNGEAGTDVDTLLDRLQPDSMMGGL